MIAKNERDPVDLYIGDRIKAARARRSVTQKQLADRIGVSVQQLQKYESAVDRVSGSRIKRIADALRFPVAFFFDGEDHGEPAGLGAEAVEFAEALAAIPDVMLRRRLLLFAQALRDDLAASEHRIRAEVMAELERRKP